MSARSRTFALIGFIGLIVIGIMLIIMTPEIKLPATPTPTIPSQRLDEGPAPEVPRVSVNDAYTAYTAKQAVFVDVRSAGQYEARHITGASSIPLADLESRLNELAKKQWIITYCT